MKHSDSERLQKILRYGEEINEEIRTRSISKEQLLSDRFIQWALTTPLYNIGEHTYGLSQELTARYSDVPWKKVAGLRHRLVHNYDDTNWLIIAEVVFADLPQYMEQIRDILADIVSRAE